MGKAAKKKIARRGDRAVLKLLERWGVFGRLHELDRTFYDQAFRDRLNEHMVALEGTPDAPTNVQQVADLAMRVARDEFGVDTTDCMLTVDWRPDLGRKLIPDFHPTVEISQRAQAQAKVDVAARAKAQGRRAA